MFALLTCRIPSATASSSSTTTGARSSIEEKPAAAEVQLRGDRPVLLRQRTSSTSPRNLKPSARGELEITDVNRAYLRARRAARRAHGPRLRLARHRHARVAAAGRQLHRRSSRSARALKVACPEEIAYRRASSTATQLRGAGRDRCARTSYGEYLLGARERVKLMKIRAARRSPDVVVHRAEGVRRRRGFFLETWQARKFARERHRRRVRAGQSQRVSVKGVLRGLHFQIRTAPGKAGAGHRAAQCSTWLLTSAQARLRRSAVGSASELSAANRRMLWVPPGFAHGFLVAERRGRLRLQVHRLLRSPDASGRCCGTIRRSGIEWPLPPGVDPVLSAKDRDGVPLAKAECFA